MNKKTVGIDLISHMFWAIDEVAYSTKLQPQRATLGPRCYAVPSPESCSYRLNVVETGGGGGPWGFSQILLKGWDSQKI